MDQYQTCQKCKTHLPEKTEADGSIKCLECGYINKALEKTIHQTISDKLAELTIQVEPGEIEKALTMINAHLSSDIMKSQDIGATVKTPRDKVEDYVSKVKRKMVGAEEEGSLDYSLIEKIGEGGMGVIYLAEQSSLGRNVALKMTKEQSDMSDLDIRNFLTEALVTGDFDHPNVVPIHDAGCDQEGRLFYIMKHVQGVTWESLINPKTKEEMKKAKRYNLIDHLNILNSVCNAVAFAHSKDVIHRDLKPSNVMIGEFGEVIVLDWGLAASVGSNDKVASIEDMNAFGGTISYMAPEMAKGQKNAIGKHSDIYLLGAILYKILTGHAPHHGNNFREAITNAILNKIKPPDKEQDIDMVLMEIALKGMSRSPTKRYLSVTTFQRALKRYIRGSTSHLKSIRLSRIATDVMNKGLEISNVKMILRAHILFEMALEFWSGNREAELGKPRTEQIMLKTAYESGEFDFLSSLMREKGMHTDTRLKAEKDKYNIFQQKHAVLSSIFSRSSVYYFLERLKKNLFSTLKIMNLVLKFYFIVILALLTYLLYKIEAPYLYISGFALSSLTGIVLGELFWKKLSHMSKDKKTY
jgi:serine/threonine protein kinase